MAEFRSANEQRPAGGVDATVKDLTVLGQASLGPWVTFQSGISNTDEGGTYTFRYKDCGGFVLFSFPNIGTLTVTSGAAAVSTDTALPAAIRPNILTYAPATFSIQGTVINSALRFNTDGTIDLLHAASTGALTGTGFTTGDAIIPQSVIVAFRQADP